MSMGTLGRMVAAAVGAERAGTVLGVLEIDPRLGGEGQTVTRAQVAMALNAALFSDLLERAPTARRYIESVGKDGKRICFDHGALRTMDGPTGKLPRGHAAFARILEPLGYAVAGLYPLRRLHMTGRAFVHRGLPETIPQFFVSELHLAELPAEAQAAGQRAFASSHDPLGGPGTDLLDRLTRDRECPLDLAEAALPGLLSAFGRQHSIPALSDYEALLAHSQEAAWIATEGNAFNHATDRVADVSALAARLKAEGYPMKTEVEHSANGRVHQTAFRADTVSRSFRLPDGGIVDRAVPGSFYEFITRHRHPATGALDLTFDSGNATGIFAVTNAA